VRTESTRPKKAAKNALGSFSSIAMEKKRKLAKSPNPPRRKVKIASVIIIVLEIEQCLGSALLKEVESWVKVGTHP
jgi:hypothetical protein